MKYKNLVCAWNCIAPFGEPNEWASLNARRKLHRIVKSNLRSDPIGKGNKAWKRYDTTCKGELHIGGNVYIT